MKSLLLLTVLSLAVFSCAQKVNEVQIKEINLSLDNKELKKKLYQQKAETDTLFKNKIEDILVLVKIPGDDKLIEVVNEEWPEEVEVTYNILKDASGSIIRISESPYSESGDWDIVYSYYFDNNGNAYANERIVSAFNTYCPDGVLIEGVSREIIVKLYNTNHTLIDSTHKMVDENDVDITVKKCQQEVRSDNIGFYSLQAYITSRNIKTEK
ncbi:hypothetical protein H8S95_08240 [Pontibacter sp. KCTC 32443]|uniref:hypothetical protein n=1 Tax=Pontibacter TaxID=323449 RepID=UPI00164D30D1|nr:MULTISPECIES: hypothetical protein [Pontibacter]MBC5774051.1 hypothetical protein [Pontibacter sp. KCTC 32443]